MAPCEPPVLFGHVFVKEQLTPACHDQTNRFTLSRPRDFISTLAKERDSSVDCRSDENPQTLTTSLENSPTLQRDGYTSTDLSAASTASRHHLRTQPEDQSPLMSTLTSDCQVTEFRDSCCPSSARTEEALNQNGEVYSDTEETEKKDG